jgi:hypothetical protein
VLGRGWYIFIGPTYDNGDKTDSWGQSSKLVPAGILPDSAYATTYNSNERLFCLSPAGVIEVLSSDQLGCFLCMA